MILIYLVVFALLVRDLLLVSRMRKSFKSLEAARRIARLTTDKPWSA